MGAQTVGLYFSSFPVCHNPYEYNERPARRVQGSAAISRRCVKLKAPGIDEWDIYPHLHIVTWLKSLESSQGLTPTQGLTTNSSPDVS